MIDLFPPTEKADVAGMMERMKPLNWASTTHDSHSLQQQIYNLWTDKWNEWRGTSASNAISVSKTGPDCVAWERHSSRTAAGCGFLCKFPLDRCKWKKCHQPIWSTLPWQRHLTGAGRVTSARPGNNTRVLSQCCILKTAQTFGAS